jgi:DNA primase
MIHDSGEYAICARVESKVRVGEAGFRHELSGEKKMSVKHKDLALINIHWNTINDIYIKSLHEMKILIPNFLTRDSANAYNCGWDRENYTFPLRDHCNNIIGIQRRRPDGSKRSIRGSRAGLFLPQGGGRSKDVVYVCEGLSDTATVYDLGFMAVGRMSASTGTELLCKLLINRNVVIVSDNDEPGLLSANHLLKKLANIAFKARIITPSTKDIRQFYIENGADKTIKLLTNE